MEDALTRKLRENKELLVAKQAEVDKLRDETGDRADHSHSIGQGRGAEWRVGVEQPNPFKPGNQTSNPYSLYHDFNNEGARGDGPPISEAMRKHPKARLSTYTPQHQDYRTQQRQRQQHQHQRQHQHQQYDSHQSAPASMHGGRSVLAPQRAEQDRLYQESRDQTRRWSSQFNADFRENQGTRI